MTRQFFCAIALFAACLGTATAWQDPPAKEAKATEKKELKAAQKTIPLDVLIRKSLEQNPDVKYAEVEVQLAMAKLNKVKLDTVQSLTLKAKQLRDELENAVDTVDIKDVDFQNSITQRETSQKAFNDARKLRNDGAISDAEYLTAKSAADLANQKSDLCSSRLASAKALAARTKADYDAFVKSLSPPEDPAPGNKAVSPFCLAVKMGSKCTHCHSGVGNPTAVPSVSVLSKFDDELQIVITHPGGTFTNLELLNDLIKIGKLKGSYRAMELKDKIDVPAGLSATFGAWLQWIQDEIPQTPGKFYVREYGLIYKLDPIPDAMTLDEYLSRTRTNPKK